MSGRPPTLYDVQQKAVTPIENLLEALVAVNIHARQCDEQGWTVTFTVDDDGEIDVAISRALSWPSFPVAEDAE